MTTEFTWSSHCYLIIKSLKDSSDQSSPKKIRHHNLCDVSTISKSAVRETICFLSGSVNWSLRWVSFHVCLYHKINEVRRDLWRSSGPITVLKQDHLEPVVQGHIQTTFDMSPRRKTPQLPRTTCASAHSKKKSVSWCSNRMFCVSICAHFASCPGTEQHWKEPGSNLFASSFQVFLYIDEIPPWAFSRLNSASSLSFSLQERFSSLLVINPLLDSVQHVHVSLVFIAENHSHLESFSHLC